MENNLLKKHVLTSSTVELAIRYDWLLHIAELAPVHVLTLADAREVLWIEDELHRRLIVAIGHDFYPPDGTPKPTVAELKASINASLIIMAKPTPQPVPKVVEPVVKTEGNLRFKVTIISSIGSIVKTLNVKVDTRSEADAVAQETIKQLGLKKAKYKIS